MSSPFDDYGRMEPAAVNLEEMDNLHKANKATIQNVAKKLSTLLVQRMKNGNFHQLKEWWKKNADHVVLKPRSLEELCKYVVAFSILAEGWQPEAYNDLVIPIQVGEFLLEELQGQPGDKGGQLASNAEMMAQMENRIVDKLRAFIGTPANANPAHANPANANPATPDRVVTNEGDQGVQRTNSDGIGTGGGIAQAPGKQSGHLRT